MSAEIVYLHANPDPIPTISVLRQAIASIILLRMKAEDDGDGDLAYASDVALGALEGMR